MIEETGSSSWCNTRVRKGNKYGTVTRDLNGIEGGRMRELTIKMDDGSIEKIVMNNVGEDPKETNEWEWYWNKTEDEKWYRF